MAERPTLSNFPPNPRGLVKFVKVPRETVNSLTKERRVDIHPPVDWARRIETTAVLARRKKAVRRFLVEVSPCRSSHAQRAFIALS